ncbi:hypothetical protein DL96DRAFT_1739565 [Flagelloscypha sp. PMI_526]|nr:hypothetical protein DL96DRAFT_1739565 [Flagelloscypha sp. PMI_526]
MTPSCLVRLLEPRVAGELPLLLEACKDIATPEMLFNVLPIIAEGHSMKMPNDRLKNLMIELFHDFNASVGFPIIHSQNPEGPRAVPAFMACFIGHLLKLKKKEDGDMCLAQLLAEVHTRTRNLRRVPVGTIVRNADRLQLFTAILEVLFCTIPLSHSLTGFGSPLDPGKLVESKPV